MKPTRVTLEHLGLGAVGAVLLGFLALPLIALFVTLSLAEFHAGLTNPLVTPALELSLVTTTATVAIVTLFGTPLAWKLANAQGRTARVIEVFFQLPVVVPPSVAGVALLLAFGRRGLFSGWLYPNETTVSFTTVAVVMAEVFVSAPFYLQPAVSAFRRLDPGVILVARSLGALPSRVFFSIAVPLAAPGLIAGAAMAWARALGEFGATLMFAGNLEGRTQTLPLAIYTALELDLRAAQSLSVVLVAVAFTLLSATRYFLRLFVTKNDIQ